MTFHLLARLEDTPEKLEIDSLGNKLYVHFQETLTARFSGKYLAVIPAAESGDGLHHLLVIDTFSSRRKLEMVNEIRQVYPCCHPYLKKIGV